MDRRDWNSEEVAKKFFLLARARMVDSKFSRIFPLNLLESNGFNYENFLSALKLLAKQDGLEIKIIRHDELSDDSRYDLVKILENDNDEFVRAIIRKNDNLKNRIYVQLRTQAASLR